MRGISPAHRHDCIRDRAARPEGRTTPPTDPDERNERIRFLGIGVSLALANLDKAVSECVWHGHASLKVIHGHGSGGGGGASRIKPQVLAVLRKDAERLGAVMEQEGDNWARM